jgi:hypothetical protein
MLVVIKTLCSVIEIEFLSEGNNRVKFNGFHFDEFIYLTKNYVYLFMKLFLRFFKSIRRLHQIYIIYEIYLSVYFVS